MKGIDDNANKEEAITCLLIGRILLKYPPFLM
jgi:hypothetical protein